MTSHKVNRHRKTFKLIIKKKIYFLTIYVEIRTETTFFISEVSPQD